MWLERRRNVWMAFHEVPADVQAAIGKKRFSKSLETTDKKDAQRRGAIVEAQWLAEIDRARTGFKDLQQGDVAYWRDAYRAATEEQRHLIVDHVEAQLDAATYKAAEREGIESRDDIQDLPERIEATRKLALITGALVPLQDHLEEYCGTLTHLKPKTASMRKTNLKAFCQRFPNVDDVTPRDAQRWVNALHQQGQKRATLQRLLSDIRGYWAYLCSIQVVPDTSQPLARIILPKDRTSADTDDSRKAFTVSEVLGLLEAATDKGDTPLADLIRLAMWTGARREELCALLVADVNGDYITIRDAKTKAGWREIPIHPKLAPLLSRLISESTDGYVLSGLTGNQYGDRGDAIGKRFSKMKAKLGMGEDYVFHSIRKTVATLLANAEVPEYIAAAILGHHIPTMTYGLYAEKKYLKVKMEAICKLSYGDQ